MHNRKIFRPERSEQIILLDYGRGMEDSQVMRIMGIEAS
jgi:hypothetical protein